MAKSEPQHLGKNDAAKGPHPYRTTPNLGDSELFPGMQAVKPEEHGTFGTRTGRNERKST
jgi:hypothetical protein